MGGEAKDAILQDVNGAGLAAEMSEGDVEDGVGGISFLESGSEIGNHGVEG
jgi:hypothetical protein